MQIFLRGGDVVDFKHRVGAGADGFGKIRTFVWFQVNIENMVMFAADAIAFQNIRQAALTAKGRNCLCI